MSQSGSGETTVETPGQRLYLVRLALGDGVKNPMRIKDFVALVRQVTGATYDPAAISRAENGERQLTLADIHAFAAVDPKRRSKAWLAFGNSEPLATFKVPDDIAQAIHDARRGAAPPVDQPEAADPPAKAAGGPRAPRSPKGRQ